MIQDIMNGIASALDDEYGHPVYTEHTKQGLTEPCFYIRLVTSNEDQIIGTRYNRRQTFDVHYFPASDLEPGQEVHSVLERLYTLLEYVQMGTDLVKGRRMRHEVIEGVLHFFVDYDLVLLKQSTPDDPMDDVHIIQKTE